MSTETNSFQDVETILADVKNNFASLIEEFNELKAKVNHSTGVNDTGSSVNKEDLEKIRRETNLMKKLIPRILDESLSAQKSEVAAHRALQLAQFQNEQNLQETQQWKEFYEVARSETDTFKQELQRTQHDLSDTVQELTQQSEYCASMGAACATLLWRVSRCEDSIQAILTGSKVEQFLALVSSTLQSYVTACAAKTDPVNAPTDPLDLSEESHFVLALCGIITNIAASSFGRNFLMRNESGERLIDVYLKMLAEAPNEECGDLKNLLLMCMYNLSINIKGLKYLQSQQNLIPLMVWLIKESHRVEIRQHSLRIIQSLLSDEECTKILHRQMADLLDTKLMNDLTTDQSQEIRSLTADIVDEIKKKL